MNVLPTASTPQLKTIHRGKVRDSLRVDVATRLLVVSDRLSAFDRVLDTPIPLKGEVLSRLANWWFEQTADVVPNHVVRAVDPVATLVREVEPIRVEMVVRGYLTGSMGRAYAAGARALGWERVGAATAVRRWCATRRGHDRNSGAPAAWATAARTCMRESPWTMAGSGQVYSRRRGRRAWVGAPHRASVRGRAPPRTGRGGH